MGMPRPFSIYGPPFSWRNYDSNRRFQYHDSFSRRPYVVNIFQWIIKTRNANKDHLKTSPKVVHDNEKCYKYQNYYILFIGAYTVQFPIRFSFQFFTFSYIRLKNVSYEHKSLQVKSKVVFDLSKLKG